MKVQIRKSVVETNSSSTHSLQLFKGSIDDMKSIIWRRIIESYDDNDRRNMDLDDYIKDGVLYLTGIYLPTGNEDSNVYTIIDSWMGKIQLLAMVIYNMCGCIDGVNLSALGYDVTPQKLHAISETELFKTFESLIKVYCKKQGYDIKEVVLDLQYTNYMEYFIGFSNNIFDTRSDKVLIPEDITDAFNKIMKDDYIVTFMDEAYHSYYMPSITIVSYENYI